MQGTYYEQPFLKHFLDAIVLCEMAEDLPHLAVSRHSSLARASIMASTFSLEAASNTLMSPIQAPGRLIELVDQGQVLDKYEFVLFGAQPTKVFDRGSKHAQAVKELFEIRNKYVHPRGQKRTITHRELGEGAITILKQDKPSNILGLPASPQDWGSQNARRVLQATSDFLDHFVIDLCELEPDLVRRLFLSTIDIDGRAGLLLPNEQRTILRRALSKSTTSFRLARILVGMEAPPPPLVVITFKYSWGLGGLQLHDQIKTIEVDAEELTHEVVVNAVQRFLIWFEEAEHYPYGRRLILFEARSEDESICATFRLHSFDWMKNAPEGTGRHRPIGLVADVEKQLFFNAILGVRREERNVFIVALLDSGDGRELKLSLESSIQLIQSVAMNRRGDWHAEEINEAKPEKIEKKGSDFEVEEVDIVAFDPRSRTTFLTYRAKSGRVIQVNMRPSTLMTIFNLVQGVVLNLTEGLPQNPNLKRTPDGPA
jgi:hypothetical protein